MSKIVDEVTLKGHNSWTTEPNFPRLCIHFAMKYFFMPLKGDKFLLNYCRDIWHQAKKRRFFKNLGHYFTLCCFFMHAYGALKVGRSEGLGLVDNHGYFGDEPLRILAKIQPETEKNKNLVFFQTPFLVFFAFFQSLWVNWGSKYHLGWEKDHLREPFQKSGQKFRSPIRHGAKNWHAHQKFLTSLLWTVIAPEPLGRISPDCAYVLLWSTSLCS